MRALLDVSVLLALLDRAHIDHTRARAWLEREIEHGWASCAITQIGFARVLSQSTYAGALSPARALDLLEGATRASAHEYWNCDLELVDASRIARERIHGPRQLTDVYLLALATSKRGRFVTLDRKIPLSAVVGASEESLVVI